MGDVLQRSLRALVEAATLAPSSHNTQPWRFRLSDAAVDLLADRVRALPVNDPEDRELVISCGAALFNLRIAAAHVGLHAAICVWPEGHADCVARVRLSDAAPSALDDATLFTYLPQRRTYRKRFLDRPVDLDVVQRLAEAATTEGAHLRPIVEASGRHSVVDLVTEGDAVQWANPSWRRELAAWMHPRRRGDGLSVPWVAVPVAQLVVRTFDMGHGEGAKNRALAEGSTLLALVETPHDTPHDWVTAGQALERVLLTGCAMGLQASYLNQPIQVPALRSRLRDVVHGQGMPQLLLRLGYPDQPVPPAARRPLDDVIDDEEAAAGIVHTTEPT